MKTIKDEKVFKEVSHITHVSFHNHTRKANVRRLHNKALTYKTWQFKSQ